MSNSQFESHISHADSVFSVYKANNETHGGAHASLQLDLLDPKLRMLPFLTNRGRCLPSTDNRPSNDVVPKRPNPLLWFIIVSPHELNPLKFSIKAEHLWQICVCLAFAVYDRLKKIIGLLNQIFISTMFCVECMH